MPPKIAKLVKKPRIHYLVKLSVADRACRVVGKPEPNPETQAR